MKDSPDDTVGALTQLLGDSVSLVDDKVLVEDLEDLPSLEVAHCCGRESVRRCRVEAG